MSQTAERLREIANALDQFRTARGENHFALFAKELRMIAKAEEVHDKARRETQQSELARSEREARTWRRRYNQLRSQIAAALADTPGVTTTLRSDVLLGDAVPAGPPPIEPQVQPPPRQNASKADDLSHPAFA